MNWDWRKVWNLVLWYEGAHPDSRSASERWGAEMEKAMIRAEAERDGDRLLGEWLKKAEAHSPEIKEFKGGYQPFLERATREYLALRATAEREGS